MSTIIWFNTKFRKIGMGTIVGMGLIPIATGGTKIAAPSGIAGKTASLLLDCERFSCPRAAESPSPFLTRLCFPSSDFIGALPLGR